MNSVVSRRRFLGWTAGIAAGTLVRLPGSSSARAADSTGGFAIGIQSYSLRNYSNEEAIRLAGEMGFETIEFFPGKYKINSTPEEIADVQDKCRAAKLKVTAHGVNRFTKDHEANRKLFEFAKKAGIRNLTADPTPDSFESLDKLVSEFDVRIAIHNHGPSHHYNKVVDVLNAVKDHHPNIGACADLGHYIRSGEDPVEVIRVLNGRLFGIHLKDFVEQEDKTKPMKGVILGRGHLDVPGVFRALKQVNFPADGALSLEYEENPTNPLDDIRECLAIAKEGAAKA